MSYEVSYDIGNRPFRSDKDRGLWSSSSDFLFACFCNAFRLDYIYGISSISAIGGGGIAALISTLLSLALYAIPIIYIQCFLGQFSSSGFISVFRVAPLFKGLGYIGLVLNIFSLAVYGVLGGIPLWYFLYSLQPTLPWSCEGAKSWMKNESYYVVSHCTVNYSNTDGDVFHFLSIPSVDFFTHQTGWLFTISLGACTLVVWGIIAMAVYNSTETIGKIFRYSAFILIAFLLMLLIRMLFVPHAIEGLNKGLFAPKRYSVEAWIFLGPILVSTTFGPGWGSVLTMASYNKFKTNITRYSWLICLTQLCVILTIGILGIITEAFITQNQNHIMTSVFDLQWSSFLAVPSCLASLPLPHLWTWIYFILLLIGCLNVMLAQMFSVLTALFDEFTDLKEYRKEITFGMAGVLAIVSLLFCTEDGLMFVEIMADQSILIQGIMNLGLLIMVLWIYGRERFQRDVKFMTNSALATWKVFTMRFVTPLFMIIILLVGCAIAIFGRRSLPYLAFLAIGLTILPWISLPAFCIYKLAEAGGSLKYRFKRCTKPVDWYPADATDRQRYEETVNNPDFSHPLTMMAF